MAGFFDLIQSLWAVALPEGAHLYAWGALAGATATCVFFLLIDRRKVVVVREAGHRARMAALQFDGDFAELWPVLGKLLANAFHNVWLHLIPIVLASAPFVVLMPWMQDRFAHVFPAPGERVEIEVSPPGTLLAPPGSGLEATDDESRYIFRWPMTGHTVAIRDSSNVLLVTVPPEKAKSSFIRATSWNTLLEPPPYLPRQSAVESLNLGMPARQYATTGNDLLDGWEFHFTAAALLAAAAGYLLLKRWERSDSDAERKSAASTAFYVDPMKHLLGVLAGRWPRFWISMGKLESRILGVRLSRVGVDRPVFIAGLARGGTTILLELLARLPGVVTHRYCDYPFVLVPYWWNRMVDLVPRPREKPIERSHGDGIFVTSRSPEAMEEILWMAFFPDTHDPERSSVVDASCAEGEFADFFRDNIRKLLLVRKGTRYVSKENYNITRLRCLITLFPDATVIVPIRHPISHIASIMKQDRLFTRALQGNPWAQTYLETVGHFEFGPIRKPIHVGSDRVADEISKCWREGDEVHGWAIYWASVYGHVAEILANDEKVARATRIVRFEDLCARPKAELQSVVAHCGFEECIPQIDDFASGIRFPSYYEHEFNQQQVEAIRRECTAVAARFGYKDLLPGSRETVC